MNKILLIETATDVCSAAVADGEKILSTGHITEARSQASRLAPMIQDTIAGAGIRLRELAAVAVSSGPGSYTGLRVGVSTAKGLCLGTGIPLISVGTLSILAFGAIRSGAVKEATENSVIIPMIDARRMEVYTALYDIHGDRISETAAVVLTPDTFTAEFEKFHRVILTGDGAAKFMDILPEHYRSRCVFLPSHPEAIDMAIPAFRSLQQKRFEDTAYFEPFYLKEFIAADPSKKLEAVLHPDRRL